MALPESKPYDIYGEPSTEKMSQLDEMLNVLYKSVSDIETTKATGLDIDLTHWTKGPWTLDEVLPTERVAVVVPAKPVAGATLNDYAPEGIDTAVALEIEPDGAGVSITGIRQYGRINRLLGIINRDSSNNLTLVNESSGSTDRFRFRLPDSANITLGPRQAAWMYYSSFDQRWQLFITPHLSGGLSSGTQIATVDVSEATLEAFNGTSGTDVTLVAAPGTNKVIYVVSAWHQIKVNTVYTNNPNVVFSYSGSATPIWTATALGSSANAGTTKFTKAVDNTYNLISSTFDPVNKAIVVNLNAALTGAGSATAKFHVVYTIVDKIV